MPVTDTKDISMTGWTDEKRHCMHLLVTHYPSSSWPDRARIYNLVCADNRTPNQVRDEYGGHRAGRRNRQGGGKPTRSVRWNDEICRDEFGLAGPFSAQQQIDRGTIFRDIQAAINTLGLSTHAGLGAVNLVAGMHMANVALANSNTAGAAPVAPAAIIAVVSASGPAPPLTGTASSSGPAQAGTSSTNATVDPSATAEDESSSDSDSPGSEEIAMVDPAEGGAAWFHSREIVREPPSMGFVYRAIPNLRHDEDNPPRTFARNVQFPSMGMQWFRVQVCTVGGCDVCGPRRRHGSSEEEEDGGDEECDEGGEDGGDEEGE